MPHYQTTLLYKIKDTPANQEESDRSFCLLPSRFSHKFSPGSLSNTFSLKATFLNLAPNVGTVGKAYVPKMGDGTRRLRLPRFSSVVNWQSRPLHDLQDAIFFFFFVFPRERSIARKEKEGEVKETYANC